MERNQETGCTAFAGTACVAAGPLGAVVLQVKTAGHDGTGILLFDDATGRPIDVDWRGTPEEAAARIGPAPTPEVAAPRGPGRPKLGVVAREVTLLPRHWTWLSGQPGGASVALRKLVEQRMRETAGQDKARLAAEAAYRFMTAVAGDLPDYEEATRALFGGRGGDFAARIVDWPQDVRDYAVRLASPAFIEESGARRTEALAGK
ncbi:Protein of unknown function DUF2239 [Solidesulfovibrio carbinoliphilus subsp. oakridgensis]|uniref:DUF2239 domain-containing protein n=1 Tax=Solidesulfovibrio carbinoliphilus subsp. oakridgensis TaxID=694327 RepID=G7Q3T3_9BACT|nr:DUF2239 family protein [Solidesulfovibrio carbinoliphilus]EHJ46723.1 Protein of unknown function DUF2239 [Solidesulfovibrio carbinoliphilus subsp. oakridgensis]